MKTKFIIIILFHFLLTGISLSQSGWFRLLTVEGTISYTDIQFMDTQTGYITNRYGDAHSNGGGVQKTTNGGLNWTNILGGVAKYGLYFINEQTGWITGGYWDDAIRISREVFKTTNGGQNFTRVYIDSVQDSFRKIFFANVSTGWTLSYNNLYKTTNSGFNWFICAELDFNSFFFLNANTGWGSSSAGKVYKTSNGGLNWNLNHITPSSGLGEITFMDLNTGWVSGSQYIYKTTNSGINWNAYESGLESIHSIEFYSSSKGWACSDSGMISMTTNGGINWTLHPSGFEHSLSNLCFPSAGTGYVFGYKFLTPYSNEFTILKTTTGGLIGFREMNSGIPETFALLQNYPNPFNPSTKIKFDIPLSPLSERGAGGFISLVIFDLLGREVTTLVNQKLKPGTYEVEWDASDYPSGVYFYKLSTESFNQTKRMVLLK